MTRTKKILLALLALPLLVAGVLQLPAVAHADNSTDAAKASSCAGIGGEIVDGKCVTGSNSLDKIISNVVNFLSVLVGIVAVIMIMVGGFKYATAAGDSGKVSSAKSTIVYAVIGLVIVALSQTIVKFVIGKTT